MTESNTTALAMDNKQVPLILLPKPTTMSSLPDTFKCLTLLITDGMHSNYNPLFLGTIFWNSSGDIK
jgi:hypothetical protein